MVTHSTATSPYDIAIVGPGHVGAAAALAFSQAGYSVALIGPAQPRRDGRTVAVMDGSWALLEKLGVTPRLEQHVAPLARMRLVDDTGSLFVRPPTEFRASEIGLDQFGWNIETSELSGALLDTVAATPAIARMEQAVTQIAINDCHAVVHVVDGQHITARLLVGADGRNSVVRQGSGIKATTWDYPQAALTTIVAHTRPHRDISTEFHTRSGPCTTVPLPGQRSSIVWMVARDEGARLLALEDAALALAIEKRTHAILGGLTVVGPRGLVPMSGLSVAHFRAARVALIGEAAHVFPPIGAQGLNLGMRDVMALVACVSHDDPGGDAGLARYERDRTADVRTRTRAVDALNRSLLSDFLPVDFARGFGLLALDTIAPLRRFVMRQGLNPSRT
ncbi:MAG: UbiH/UbiF family hydroxylase [Bosea sp. (in: a-proteobacteria)]